MTMQALQPNLRERLKDDLLKAWRTGHGGAADTVHLLQGEEGLALMIPKGLLQAEIELSRKAGGGRLIQNYIRELLLLISNEMIPSVEEFTGRRVQVVDPLVDLRAGWIISFFRFKEPVDGD